MTREPFRIVTCVHYNLAGLPCKKGVEASQVTDDEHRTPCVAIRGITGKVACDLRVMPVEPSVDGELGQASRMLAQVLAGKCPRCNNPIAGEMEFNGAILALPCRHVLRSARD